MMHTKNVFCTSRTRSYLQSTGSNSPVCKPRPCVWCVLMQHHSAGTAPQEHRAPQCWHSTTGALRTTRGTAIPTVPVFCASSHHSACFMYQLVPAPPATPARYRSTRARGVGVEAQILSMVHKGTRCRCGSPDLINGPQGPEVSVSKPRSYQWSTRARGVGVEAKILSMVRVCAQDMALTTVPPLAPVEVRLVHVVHPAKQQQRDLAGKCVLCLEVWQQVGKDEPQADYPQHEARRRDHHERVVRGGVALLLGHVVHVRGSHEVVAEEGGEAVLQVGHVRGALHVCRGRGRVCFEMRGVRMRGQRRLQSKFLRP
eukprot:363457-Chlamydomonas_euryale.AAC.4